ncbi:hypothetical protein [Hoylesella shahii]|uniref:hypothetical protein n=1 Tax=Hoylesella shahii TaxID=228603 RepID=UPI0028D5FA87|nr:hypothetical protein [Hoylesella shahii]
MENKVLNKLNTLGGKGASPSMSEEKEYTSTKAEMEIANLQEELDGRKQDREQRKVFALWIFGLVCVYLLVVLTAVYFVGFGLMVLNDIVLNVLLTTTTANVIGIFIIVAKYLFHR